MNVYAQKLLHFLEYLIWFSSYFSSNFQIPLLLLKLHVWYQQPVSESCHYCHGSTSRWEPFVAGKAWVNSLTIRNDSIFIPPQTGQRTVLERNKNPQNKGLPTEMGRDIWGREEIFSQPWRKKWCKGDFCKQRGRGLLFKSKVKRDEAGDAEIAKVGALGRRGSCPGILAFPGPSPHTEGEAARREKGLPASCSASAMMWNRMLLLLKLVNSNLWKPKDFGTLLPNCP